MKKILTALAILSLLIAPALASTEEAEDWYTWYENQKGAQEGHAESEEYAQANVKTAPEGAAEKNYVASADTQTQYYQYDQYAATPPQPQDPTYQNDGEQTPGYVGGSDEPQNVPPQQPAAEDSEWIWVETSDDLTQ